MGQQAMAMATKKAKAKPNPNQRDTVEQAWRAFREAVIPPTASVAQLVDMRMAFFAGACVLFHVMTDASAYLSEGDACRLMDNLNREVRAFGAQLDAQIQHTAAQRARGAPH
jgi:hypothetical protein